LDTSIERIAYSSEGVDGKVYKPEDLLLLLSMRYGDYIKLELGAGRRGDPPWEKAPWATIGLNPSADPHSDIYWDLESGIPLPDKCIDEIYSNQTLEHIENIIHLMNECWRVLKPGGFMFACVPHRASPYAWADPTHKRVFVRESFLYYCQDEHGEPFVAHFSDYGIRCNFILEKCDVRPRIDIHVTLRKPNEEDLE
jgi:SAM-dependent methyltransferase